MSPQVIEEKATVSATRSTSWMPPVREARRAVSKQQLSVDTANTIETDIVRTRAVATEAGAVATRTSELRTIATGNVYSETKPGEAETAIEKRERTTIGAEQATVETGSAGTGTKETAYQDSRYVYTPSV